MSRTVITFGTFDVFHVGHLRVIERAASLGDRLVVVAGCESEKDMGCSSSSSQVVNDSEYPAVHA